MINTSKIFTSPDTFIFSLNRGNLEQNNNLLDIKFIIDEKIDLTSFIEQNVYKEYKLGAIISINNNSSDYKYVCFYKSPFDQKWYLYHNNNINPIEIDAILMDHNENNNFIPCILAYNLDK